MFVRGMGSWPECPDVFFSPLAPPTGNKENTAGSRDYVCPICNSGVEFNFERAGSDLRPFSTDFLIHNVIPLS